MSSDDPDRALVEQVQTGQDRAFDELMARYKKPILNFVYRMIGDAHEAEDVAQDVFVHAYRNLPRFTPRPGAKFSTWLFQLARNAAIDRLRKRGRADFQSLEELKRDFPGMGRNPADQSDLSDLSDLIARAVAALPEDQRTAFVLSEYHGMATAEIAAVMDTSEKSVESRLYRARHTLRTALRALRP
jgi:RNA polymerase sigma-70 factor (ECF subfamily)